MWQKHDGRFSRGSAAKLIRKMVIRMFYKVVIAAYHASPYGLAGDDCRNAHLQAQAQHAGSVS
jgi:hypothetical protein